MNVVFVAAVESKAHAFEYSASQKVYSMTANTTITTTEYNEHIRYIYTTTRNHKYLLVYKGVNACMCYLLSCTNIHKGKTKVLIIVLTNTNYKRVYCA